eukprot:TRINITY_DN6553_c0_g1_i1.p1 TRINITY_DN6553_c0_g1~~TRINITY_DN6553_c0_g1_i1.p1  ORF type:complete len:444 (+),score=80.53 TRINITY_DN6553_c0_g1_i1:395-1726(+)
MANLHFGNIKFEVAANIYFLRFLCPALVSPEKYGIRDSMVPPNARRTFILLSKLLQNLAFDVKPQDDYKESYMVPLHEMMAESADAMSGFMELLIHQTSDTMSLSSQKRKESVIDDSIKQALNYIHYHLNRNFAKIESHYSSSRRGSRTVPVLMIMACLKDELDNYVVKDEKEKKDKRKKKKKKKRSYDDDLMLLGGISRSSSEHIEKTTHESLNHSSTHTKQMRSMSVTNPPIEEDPSPPPSPPLSPVSPTMSPILSATPSPCLSPVTSPPDSPRMTLSSPESLNPSSPSPPSSDREKRDSTSSNNSNTSNKSDHSIANQSTPQKLGDSMEFSDKVIIAPVERVEGEDMRDYVERLQAEVRVLQMRLQDEIQLRRSLNKVLVRITDDIATEVKLRVARELATAKRGNSKHDKKKKHSKEAEDVSANKTRNRSTSHGDNHFFY